jgi:hypothetical protein
MNFEISVRGLECTLGKYASVTFTPKKSSTEALLAEFPERSKTVNLVLALDVSGSMENNMQHLINSSLAAIDLLEDSNYVKVITFDVAINHVLERTKITKDNREAIKNTVRLNIMNRGLCTNLEEPLYECLLGEDQNILLISDGHANRGSAMTSTDLIQTVRSCRNYNRNKFHCLGLQILDCDLNGHLLQTMASDTDGTYILAKTNDAILTFLGDVLSSHLMIRMTDCRASLTLNNRPMRLISNVPISGFTLRADRATTLVFAVTENFGPAEVRMSGSFEPLESIIHSRTCEMSEPSLDDVFNIFKGIASTVIQDPASIHLLIQELTSRINGGHGALQSIVESLNAVLLPSLGEADQSNHVYSLSASSNQETDVVHDMRARSRMASQMASQSQSDPS